MRQIALLVSKVVLNNNLNFAVAALRSTKLGAGGRFSGGKTPDPMPAS
jgi:hypothetical protein